MAVSSLLIFLSVALSFIALIFFLLALGRVHRRVRRSAGESERPESVEQTRLRLVQRADRLCGSALLIVALIAAAVAFFGTGPIFTEPSGNAAGGALLIALVMFVLVSALLLIRYVILSRALRGPAASVRQPDVQ